jgi:hypothetical protein
MLLFHCLLLFPACSCSTAFSTAFCTTFLRIGAFRTDFSFPVDLIGDIALPAALTGDIDSGCKKSQYRRAKLFYEL